LPGVLAVTAECLGKLIVSDSHFGDLATDQRIMLDHDPHNGNVSETIANDL